jgi:DNA polymerase III subunit delta
MTGNIAKALAEIQRGKRAPVYLLVGDEFLGRAGAKAIVDALVPGANQSLSVETVGDDDAADVAARLRTVSLLGGLKVVVVHDTKAFVSKQNVGELFKRSRDAWKEDDHARAVRSLAQAMGAGGLDRPFAERAAHAEVPAAVWEQTVGLKRDEESERWLQETSFRLMADGVEIPAGAGAATAKLYEDLLEQGIPTGAVLILTAEVVDQRRALFKRAVESGFVVDCGVRAGKLGETQMRPDVARARIKDAADQAGKRMDEEAIAAVVARTGFSVRTLDAELEKIFLYVGSRADVRTPDVLEVLSNSREASIFDLTSALEERDAAGAIRALRALAAQREAAPPILGMMANTVRSLILARCVVDARLDGQVDPRMPYGTFQARVLPRLAAAGETDDGSAAKIRDMHPFRAFNLLKAAGRFAQTELVRGLCAVHDADLALKTTGQPEGLILETLALTLCGGETSTR